MNIGAAKSGNWDYVGEEILDKYFCYKISLA